MEEGVSSSGSSRDKSSLSEEHPPHDKEQQKQKRYREATTISPAVVGCSSDRKKKKSGWDDAPSSSAAPVGGGLDGVVSHFQSNGASSSNGDVGLRQLQAASMAALLQNRASMSQMCRIYVGSLDYSLNELDIRHVFNPFGTIVNIDMPKEGNRSKGFCFVEFATPQMAELALATMPGFLLKGRPLKLGRPSALGVQPSTAIPSPQQVLGGLSNLFTGVATNPSASLSHLALLGGGGGVQSVAFNHSATMSMLSQLPGSILNQTVASSMLLQNCLGGFSGTSSSAAAANQNQPSTVTRITIRNVPPSFSASDLQQIFQVFGPIKSCSISSEMTESAVAEMDFYVHANAKLAVDTMNGFKVAGNEFIVAFDPLQLHSPSSATKDVTKVDEAPSSESPSEKLSKESSVVLLTNMVDKSEVDDELEAEILSECSRYGRVEKVKIDVDDSESDPERIVKVFIEFANNTSAANAIPKLEGRLFGGRKIRASLYY